MYRTLGSLGLGPVLLAAGCAPLTNKSARHISMVSDVPVECVFTDNLGPRRFQAPGIVYAEPKHGPTNLRCEKGGYKPFSATVDTELNDMALSSFMEPATFASEAEREAWLEERTRGCASSRSARA